MNSSEKNNFTYIYLIVIKLVSNVVSFLLLVKCKTPDFIYTEH